MWAIQCPVIREMETSCWHCFSLFRWHFETGLSRRKEYPLLAKESSLYRLFPAMAAIGTISTHDLVVEWTIQHFFTLGVGDSAWYGSPIFSFDGEEWWLVINPNGSSRRTEHVDLAIAKLSGPSIRLFISLSLKTVKGQKYKEQHCIKDFKESPENVYLFRRFISRLELSQRRSDLVPDDDMTVVCTMKRPTPERRDSKSL